MSTRMIQNYGIYRFSDPKPFWFTSERYDYCEPYVSVSSFRKWVEKGAAMLRSFRMKTN